MLHKETAKQQSGTQPAEIKENQVSFLIEGSGHAAGRFPEIAAAIQMAIANKCSYFDSISAFDSEHIGELLKNKSEKEQKAILLCISSAFLRVGSIESIIENLLKKPYRDLVQAGVYKEVPTWLNNLSVDTLDSFTKSVVDEIAHGDLEEFKRYNSKIQQESAQLSDRISTARFLAYINNNTSITTIYGLIGWKHLDMLNSIGVVSKRSKNYRLVKISIKGRADVEVLLFGGKHGEMTHYQQLASYARQRGLIVPAPPTQNVSSSKSQTEERDSDRPQEEDKHSTKTTDELAQRFDFWMKEYTHSKDETHNQELVSWLTADSGAEDVKTYKEFCDLALLLSSTKYNYATQEPPSEADYKQATEKFTNKQPSSRSPDSFFETRLGREQNVANESTDVLAQRFDFWMKEYTHSKDETHNQELVSWLIADSGAKHVKTYKEFCDLALLLSNTKYNYSTQPPPTESEFNNALQKALQKFNKKQQKHRHR